MEESRFLIKRGPDKDAHVSWDGNVLLIGTPTSSPDRSTAIESQTVDVYLLQNGKNGNNLCQIGITFPPRTNCKVRIIKRNDDNSPWAVAGERDVTFESSGSAMFHFRNANHVTHERWKIIVFMFNQGPVTKFETSIIRVVPKESICVNKIKGFNPVGIPNLSGRPGIPRNEPRDIFEMEVRLRKHHENMFSNLEQSIDLRLREMEIRLNLMSKKISKHNGTAVEPSLPSNRVINALCNSQSINKVCEF